MSDSADPALNIHGLHHSFRNHHAVQGLSFQVDRASIHGFVGPNGAGKTTTLRIIATLLAPQKGVVQVFGADVVRQTDQVRRRIGFMPDHFSMYRQMTVFEYLDFFAAAYGRPARERDRVIGDVLELTDMSGRHNDLIRGLSRGMQQRVGLARVLVHDPDLLLLDEPASGLDPRARIELMEILRELRRMGKTIFISSHILSELADLCDAVTIIDRGQVRFSGPVETLLSHQNSDATRSVEVGLTACGPECVAAIGRIDGVLSVQETGVPGRLLVGYDPAKLDPPALLRGILNAGGCVERFAPAMRHLNEAFMDLTQPGVRQ